MSCCGGSSGGNGQNGCNLYSLMSDPCYQKLCCNQRRQVCYKPFIPSYERCEEEVKMGKLLGFDYQRRWFCERNVYLCKVYGQCGGNNNANQCQPPPCAPQRPACCGSPCSISPCCPAPRLSLCQPDPCGPCCIPQRPCPPRCPPNPVFPKVCCPPPCCPDPCIKPSRKCFIPPPCCKAPCCKKMALVVNPPMCPPKCCPPLPCCEPEQCPDPCARGQSTCCGPCCPSPAMIVRPLRSNCCPPPPRIPNNNQCPIPCCNPLPPCCVIVKPCQPRCPPSPCCAPPPLCAPACPQPDPRCCPKPMVVSFKCPTSVCPMNRSNDDECPQQISWPQPPKIDLCCPSNCPPKERDMCFMTVRPMPPSCCPPKPPCGGGGSSGGNSRKCCKPRWNGTPSKCQSQSVDFSVPRLASLSQRYNCWVGSVQPVTDSNFCPSRFSSRVENSDCQIIAVNPPVEAGYGESCPCHM